MDQIIQKTTNYTVNMYYMLKLFTNDILKLCVKYVIFCLPDILEANTCCAPNNISTKFLSRLYLYYLKPENVSKNGTYL